MIMKLKGAIHFRRAIERATSSVDRARVRLLALLLLLYLLVLILLLLMFFTVPEYGGVTSGPRLLALLLLLYLLVLILLILMFFTVPEYGGVAPSPSLPTSCFCHCPCCRHRPLSLLSSISPSPCLMSFSIALPQ